MLFRSIRLTTERKQDARVVLPEAAALLKSVIHRAFGRMAEIDRRLRGKGFPQSVSLQSTSNEIAEVEAFVERRIAAEVSMVKRRYRINDFYNEHPFLFWFIALLVGSLVTFAAN